MNVLVACEFSGVVRDAFIARGHNAVSCDLLCSESDGPHLQEDVFQVLRRRIFDLMIFHWPCTNMASSGARWFKAKADAQAADVEAFKRLMRADVPMIAGENPIGVLSSQYRKPDQIIQPWQFGHGEVKATCLWLKNLPKLAPTDLVDGRVARVHREPPSPERWKNRSRTYPVIAQAMAIQWGAESRTPVR